MEYHRKWKDWALKIRAEVMATKVLHGRVTEQPAQGINQLRNALCQKQEEIIRDGKDQ